jgi:hypothetical protein
MQSAKDDRAKWNCKRRSDKAAVHLKSMNVNFAGAGLRANRDL